MTTLRTLYEAVEPLEAGHLAVGDGHEIYFECCGNPFSYLLLLLALFCWHCRAPYMPNPGAIT